MSCETNFVIEQFNHFNEQTGEHMLRNQSTDWVKNNDEKKKYIGLYIYAKIKISARI